MLFVQFTSIYAVSPELLLKNLDIEKSANEEGHVPSFSLKASYSPGLLISDPDSSALAGQAGSDTEAEIKRLKSKRLWSWVGALASIGVGGFLVYKFATYEEEKTVDQFGVEKEHTQTNSFSQWGYLIGGLLCGGIAAALISSASRTSKTIKEYEAELRASAAARR
jgi:hypothetical protein